MRAFKYERCRDLSQALAALEQESAFPLAGGTDLLVSMRRGKHRPALVVDIKDIPQLHRLEETNEGIIIGACTNLNIISSSPLIREKLPVLAEACRSIGTYSVRNRGTLVGNLCNASPAADTAPILYCLEARVNVAGPKGERSLPIQDFMLCPGQTALEKGELVTSVLIPKPYPEEKGVYYKFSRTGAVDLATVGVAVQRFGGEVRIALGAVAPTPVRARSVEKAVNEGEKDFYKAASLVDQDIAPISDPRGSKEFRYHLARVLVRRGLEATKEV